MKKLTTILLLFSILTMLSCSKDNSNSGFKRVKELGCGVNTPRLKIGTKSGAKKVFAISDIYDFNGVKLVATLQEESPVTKASTIYQSVNSVDAFTFYTTSNYIRDNQKNLVVGGKFEVPVNDDDYGMIFLAYGDNSKGFDEALNKVTPVEVKIDNPNEPNRQISFVANSGDNICYADYDKNNMPSTDVNILLYPLFSQLKIDISGVVATIHGVTFASASVSEGVQSSANVSIKFEQPTTSTTENIFSCKTNKFTIKYPYTANETINLTVSNSSSVTEQNLIPNGKPFILNLGLNDGTNTKTNAIKFYAETDTNKENPLPLVSGTRYILNIMSVSAEGEFITEIVAEGHDHEDGETLN